jgi:farnesyl-diphosphate farnesyltransferase
MEAGERLFRSSKHMDAFIAKHLQGVSRTYAILVPMLPGSLADAVGLAYLLMRIVDTLEDDPQLTTEQRLRYLELLEAALGGDAQAAAGLGRPLALDSALRAKLADREAIVAAARPTLCQGLGDTPHEQELMRDAPQVLTRVEALDPPYRDAIRTCAQAMSQGVCRLIGRSAERGVPYPAVRDAAELREYCYYVAGVVGEMLCAMMAHFLRLPALGRLRALAVELGIGLQLVNILKDAIQDSQHGRRYLPLAEGGEVARAEIYRAVLGEARRSLQRGIEFVLALPAAARELRSFCGLPIAWGAMTLARAERDARRAKISRGAIRSSIQRFARLAGDDQALRQWLSSMLGSAHGSEQAAGGLA